MRSTLIPQKEESVTSSPRCSETSSIPLLDSVWNPEPAGAAYSGRVRFSGILPQFSYRLQPAARHRGEIRPNFTASPKFHSQAVAALTRPLRSVQSRASRKHTGLTICLPWRSRRAPRRCAHPVPRPQAAVSIAGNGPIAAKRCCMPMYKYPREPSYQIRISRPRQINCGASPSISKKYHHL